MKPSAVSLRLPSPPMMALRSIATIELSAVIGQAGWAAAGLGRDKRYFTMHAIGAGVTLMSCVVGAGMYAMLRRHAGPVCTTLAVVVGVVACAQYLLGEAKVLDVHIFLGVLTAMLLTAQTSWTYRHDDTRAEDPQAPGAVHGTTPGVTDVA